VKLTLPDADGDLKPRVPLSPLHVGMIGNRLGAVRMATASAALPFVGRELVLERLERALADAAAGRGRVCVLMGEPGIGKTRVVEELAARLSGGDVRLLWGFCREVGNTPPLWPWLQLLEGVLDALPESDRPVVTEAVDELSSLLTPRVGGARALHGEAQLALPHHSFDLIVRAFVRAARSSTWVLVLDDLHRADAASLELLGSMIDALTHARILIVVNLRHAPGSRAPRPDTRLPYVLGHRSCERIVLERLHEEDVAGYVAALVDDADGAAGRTVFAQSEGHPFFMKELTREVRSHALAPPESLAPPDLARRLVRQRVARLAPEVREVVSAAAMIARSFELGLLEEVTGRPREQLRAALEEATVADLVIASSASPSGFAFVHDFVRSVLCDGLTRLEQQRWHVLIADALERRLAAGSAVPPSELAYHLHAALPASDLRKTVHFCRKAAEAAAAVFANADVVRYLRQALEALALMPAASVRLRLSLLYMLAMYGRGQRSRDVVHWISELVRLARDHASPLMLARAALMLNAYPGFKPIAGARTALDHAISLLPPETGGERAVALVALSCTAPYCYSAAQSRALLAEAVPLAAQSGSRAARYLTLVGKLYVEGGPDHEREANEAAHALTQLHRESPTARMVLAPLYVALYRAVNALQRGDSGGIVQAVELGSAHCRAIRHTLLWHFERFRALAQVNAGNWADALPALVALHRRAEQHAILGTEPFCAFDRIVIFGEIGEDVPVLDDALRSALDLDASEPPSIWSMKVRALATIGLTGEARAALRAVPPHKLAALPCDSQYLGTLGHLARAAVRLDERPTMEALYTLLARYPDYYAGHVSFLCEGSVPHLLGLLACALGRHDAACAHFADGVQRDDRAGLLLRGAEARLAWAECLLEHGDPSERARGIALAREAFRVAGRVGIRSLARRVSASLRGLDLS